jgi:tetratricopeptide (TPR) repeat protein
MKILPALAAAMFLGAGSPPTAAPDDARALMLQARSLQRESGGSDPQGAVALYRKVIALVPNSSQAYLRLSESLLDTGDVTASVEPAVKATELDPRSGEAWAHLGLLYYQLSQSRESYRLAAVTALKQAVRLLPAEPELWTRLAETQDGLRDGEGALKSWLSVGRLRPAATYRGRGLAEYAWLRAVELSIQQRNYDARREAVLALCDSTYPDQRYLKYLEDLAQDQMDSHFLGHAEESFTLLGQYLPKLPVIWENIAMIQMRTYRFDAALETLARAESLLKSAPVSYEMGVCLMKLGSFPEAEARWKEMLPTLGSEEDADLAAKTRVQYAICLILSGRPKEMLEQSDAWPGTSADPDLLSLRTQALIQVEDWKQARAALKDGMARFPAQALFQVAAALPPKLFDEGRFFKNDSRQALTQMNLEAMAELWAEFRNWQRCLETVTLARKTAPVRDVELLLLQATALENLGQSAQAIQVLREGQKLDPKHPVLQNNLGFSLLERGNAPDLPEAARLIQAALAQEPQNASTMDSWGWVLYKQGKFTEAETALRKAADLSPYSPEVHQHLGEALLKLDRPQEALEEWERALAFAFPQRKALEDQAQALRIRMAKIQAAKAESEAQPDDPAGSDDEPDPEEAD